MKPIRKALARPGRISGQVTVRKVYQRRGAQGLGGFLEAGSDALQHAQQHHHRDRRERQHLRDGDAGHAVDPAAARDVEQVAEPHRDHAGAAEQQDQRQSDDERRRDDRQDRQRAQQPFHPHAGAQRDQREGQAEQRGQHADEAASATRVPRHAAAARAGDAAQAPDRWAEQLGREHAGGEAAVVVAHRGGQDAEHRVEHEQRDQADDQQQRSGDEHVAFAHAHPCQAVGEQHEAGERIQCRAPAHGRLARPLAEQSGEPGIGPAAMDDQQAFGDEPGEAGGARSDQETRCLLGRLAGQRGPGCQQQRQGQREQPGAAGEQRRRRDTAVEAVPWNDEQRGPPGGQPEQQNAVARRLAISVRSSPRSSTCRAAACAWRTSRTWRNRIRSA